MRMTLYDIFMIPLERIGIRKARKSLIPLARGTVLEVGSGTGANHSFYNFENIESITLSDKKLTKAIQKKTNVTLIETDVTKLPFEDETFDYVIATLVFCSVPDVAQGMKEIERVLKPGGRFIYIEHVLPKNRGLKRMFNCIAPAWKWFASGCHLNRDFAKSLSNTGMIVENQRWFGNTIFVHGVSIKS